MTFLPQASSPGGAGLVVTDPSSAAVDAFGRARVSEPFTIFDCQFHRDKQPLLFDEAVVGTGVATFNATQHLIDMSTGGTASGAEVVRQTYQYHRYQPGKSQRILLTGVLGAIKANVRKRVGYFDANNGPFFEISGTDVAVVLRNNASDANRVVQASWNIDPMDGTGPSGVTIDWDNAQILAMDLEWLGVGSVRMALVVDGIIYPVHQFRNANNITATYMQTANLPVRYEITNTGIAASATTMKQICCSVQSEGGFNPLAIPRGVDNGVAGRNISNGSLIPLVSIRLKAANNRDQLVPRTAGFSTSANQEFLVRLILNATLGGGTTWNSAGTNSIAEFDIASGTISGGETLFSFPTAQDARLNASISSLIRLGADIAGIADTLTLAVIQRAGGNSNVFASLGFDELS